jgi:hypothetical protein
VDGKAQDKDAVGLGARIEAFPKVRFNGVHFEARPPAIGWESGAVSGLAVDGEGNVYEIQCGERADPVLVLDRDGKILRSWGQGDHKIPPSCPRRSCGQRMDRGCCFFYRHQVFLAWQKADDHSCRRAAGKRQLVPWNHGRRVWT